MKIQNICPINYNTTGIYAPGCLSRKEGIQEVVNTVIFHRIHCNLDTIVNSLPPSHDFSQFRFSCKNFLSPPVSCVKIFNYHLIIEIPFHLCYEVDCPLNHVRKSPPQIGAFIEMWVWRSYFSPTKPIFKNLCKKPWPQRSSQPLAKGSSPRANPLSPLGALFPWATSILTPSWKRRSPHLRGGSRRHPPAINLRSPTPPNIPWHEGEDGEAACPVRLWVGAIRTGSRKYGPWVGEDKVLKWSTPRQYHDPPEHSRSASIVREAHWCGGYKWRAVLKPEAS